jgi:tetratricopeptide (TPR) repeat protein
VAEDRNQLEQQAFMLLQKGKDDDAIDVYLKILKLSKGDIRVRQKLADLYLAQGRKPEAIRQLRDVAAGQVKEGQHRAAVVVLKQLHKLNPTDIPTLGMLGDAHRETGFMGEAREVYEQVIDMLQQKPRMALPYVEKLIQIAPGEIPPKITLAEVLARCGQADTAFEQWVSLGKESRRRGKTIDQAMFMERALKIQEENRGCLESAAEARIALGAPKEALVHIQKAYAIDPSSTHVLSMLAQCFELMDQKPKAKKVLVQLAKIHDEGGSAVERLKALSRALSCDPEDADLQSEVGAADSLAKKVQMRLTDHDWSAPESLEEAEVVISARVLADYGMLERAKDSIESSNGLRNVNSVRALLAEVLAEMGEIESAIAEMDKIDAGDDAKVHVSTRVLVLRGDYDSLGAGNEEVSDDVDIEVEYQDGEDDIEIEIEVDDSDDGIDEEATSADGDHEAEGDRLAATGDLDAAQAAYRMALDSDPVNEEVLRKLGELIARSEPDEEPMDMPVEAMEDLSPMGGPSGMPDFKNIMDGRAAESSAPVPSSPAHEVDPDILGGQGLILLGMYEEVESRFDGREDLPVVALLAEIACLRGDVKTARRVLREAMDEVDEDGKGYAEGLWGLARYAAMSGKSRTALRLLGELETLAPGYRSSDVAAFKKAIDILDS